MRQTKKSPGEKTINDIKRAISKQYSSEEKTVKSWFSGTYGPSGAHLIALARQSDEVLITFLAMAGREDLRVAIKLAAAEDAISDLLDAVRQLGGDDLNGKIS